MGIFLFGEIVRGSGCNLNQLKFTTSPKERTMPISSGIPAPDFELLDNSNTPRKLSDFRGRNVILYFYPKMILPDARRKLVISAMIIPLTKRQGWLY